MENKKYKKRFLRHLISMPFIWIVLIPIVFLDIIVEIYHRICFPLYGIPWVKRSDYIKIDRHKLSYLNLFEKIGCAYCGYANGAFQYFVKIGAETEKYWCGIKHKKDKGFNEPSHHKNFVKYGDKKEFEKVYSKR